MKKKIKYLVIVITMFGMVNPVWAEFRSDNYIIFENINHEFDGPVITSVSSSSVGESGATITWTTDVIANSFVVYSTNSNMSSSFEQGTDSKTYTSHSVTLVGLSAGTTYYYQVRSERTNGGVTTDSTTNSFSTSAAAATAETPSGGGGGMLIIDKTDKFSPEIVNVVIDEINSDSVTISWETDEDATHFVEYGFTDEYGSTYGNWASTTEHTVTVPELLPAVRYYFRVLSSDDWGNVGYSDPGDFITLNADGEEVEEPIAPEEAGDQSATIGELEDALRRFRDFIDRLVPGVALNELEPISEIGSLEELVNFLPAPILQGEPIVEIGATDVIVKWRTSTDANSLVAIASEDEYSPEGLEPYIQIVGSPEIYTTDHDVRIINLKPETVYHFQLRSKSLIGPTARSNDFTFQTRLEELEITSFFSQIENMETATFKWVTNKDADSTVKVIPYHNNILAVDESKTYRDNELSVIHEIQVPEFEAGGIYQILLSSTDISGNVATEEMSVFSTSPDDLPPIISYIKADSTIFVDKTNKIQTVISWLTNEPSTSKVYYQEGVHGGTTKLANETILNTDYSKEHVMVMTKFKPGKVYSFRVESIDSGGNISISKAHTFMTARRRESIIQMILRILEETFGWVKDLV